jgi:gluconate 2-dehydrogenase gamma chain
MADRRQVILGLMIALGGAPVAGCDSAGNDEILRALRPGGRLAFYRESEFRLVGLLADAIIPRTDTPGAIEAGVPAYMDAMLAAWASDATKTKHRQTLRELRTRLREIGGKQLARLPDAERRAAIAALDAEAYADDAGGMRMPFFGGAGGGGGEPETLIQRYRGLKTLIAQVYYATEAGATQELQYELVPGRWLADAPLSQIGRTWAE